MLTYSSLICQGERKICLIICITEMVMYSSNAIQRNCSCWLYECRKERTTDFVFSCIVICTYVNGIGPQSTFVFPILLTRVSVFKYLDVLFVINK